MSATSEVTGPTDSGVDTIVLLLGGFLGLPTALLSKLLPLLGWLFQRYPRVARIISYALATSFSINVVLNKVLSLWRYLLSFYSTSISIDARDSLAESLRCWVEAKKKFLPRENHRQCTSTDRLKVQRDLRGWGSTKERAYVTDSVYNYRGFVHEGRFFLYQRIQDTTKSNARFVLTCLGRSQAPLLAILDTAVEASKAQQEENEVTLTNVYRPDHAELYWDRQISKASRPLSSVELPEHTKHGLINDIARFYHPKTEAIYKAKNINHRRGYLFHGPPGNGKSSLALAIAGRFKLGVYIVSLQDPELTDASLASYMGLLSDTPALVLIEDIDSAGIDRESELQKRSLGTDGKMRKKIVRSQITLSGLLNAIDGVSAPEGHILIMTSNHPEALDSALVRPGRVDKIIEFTNATSEQLYGMFLRFYHEVDVEDSAEHAGEMNPALVAGSTNDVPFPLDRKHDLSQEELERLAIAFAKSIPDQLCSVAEIQEFFIARFGEPQRAVDEIGAWAQEFKSEKAGGEEDEIEDASSEESSGDEETEANTGSVLSDDDVVKAAEG